jgi:hypothetical protein
MTAGSALIVRKTGAHRAPLQLVSRRLAMRFPKILLTQLDD